MRTRIDKIQKKYEVDFGKVKYPYGAMNLIYSLEKDKLLARISKNQDDFSFSMSLALHERDLSRKLGQKGYPVANVEGVYKIFHKNFGDFFPGLVLEDKKDFVMLRSVPNMYYGYFKNYYQEVLTNAEKEGFVVGDTNEGNCLCDLKNKEICLIDFEDWGYQGIGKKVISPRWNYLCEN